MPDVMLPERFHDLATGRPRFARRVADLAGLDGFAALPIVRRSGAGA